MIEWMKVNDFTWEHPQKEIWVHGGTQCNEVKFRPFIKDRDGLILYLFNGAGYDSLNEATQKAEQYLNGDEKVWT